MMDAKFCAHQTRKTLSELREMGFSDEQLDKIGDHEHVDMDTSPEVLARHDDLNITKVSTPRDIRTKSAMSW